MRKVTEILRQKLELGRSHREIATSVGKSAGVVSATVTRAKAAGIDWVIALASSLFADLADDLELATRVLRHIWPERIVRVTKIGFEYSPGRGLPKYTDDRTAFDVYVEHSTGRGGRGFVGVEVKYHEALNDAPAKHRPRYDAVTAAMGCFKADRVSGLRRKPIEQLWRDHMLAGAMMLDSAAGWETGLYAFLYPSGNEPCRLATLQYRDHLSDPTGFDPLTLEQVVTALDAEVRAQWTAELRDRYLAWEKIPAAWCRPGRYRHLS